MASVLPEGDAVSDQVTALHRQADALLHQDRREEAITAYRRLLVLRPDLTDSWYNLGYLLKAQGRYDEALEAYGQALVHGIAHPEEVHLNCAVIYADHLRRDAEAERELGAALAIAPGYAPALLNLGNLHEERGDRSQAIACYERIVSQPGDGGPERFEALARMVQLQPPADGNDPWLQQLQQAATTTAALDDSVRANLLFALGRARDALGTHDQAFDAFAGGNRCARRTGPAYDRARSQRLTDALVATFATAADARPATDVGTGAAPLFICGMFRSGSTLLEQVLSTHPQVTPGGELDVLPRLVAGPLAPFPASLATPDPAREAGLATAYRARLAELFPHGAAGAYVTDKRPDNFLLIGLIKRMFPGARIIHTVRHPLDNGLSVFMQHIDQRIAAYASDLGDIGHRYGQYRRLMAHWKALWPDDILDFDYDDFVRDPGPSLQRLFGFLGLEGDDRCLEFHRLGNTVKTASYWQVRRPLYGDASGRWRHYQTQLAPLQQALREAGVSWAD